MTDSRIFWPLDPLAVSAEWLRRWTRLLLEAEQVAAELGLGLPMLLPGEAPVEAVDFRCWLCRRVFRRCGTDAEAVAEFERKYPGEEMDSERDFCGDCMTVTEAWFAENPETRDE